MVKYTLKNSVFFYIKLVKNLSKNCIKECFAVSILVFEFRLHQWSTGSFLDKNYTTQNDCANWKKPQWNWSQIRTLALQIPDTISSKGTGFNHSSTEIKHHIYCHIKSNRFKHMKMKEEHTFVIGFCKQYTTVSLTKIYIVYWRSLVGSDWVYSQNNRYWSSINLRQTSEVPLHDQKIGV
jgi:hypothetical protein